MEILTASAQRVTDCLENPNQASHKEAAGVNAIHHDECALQTLALKGLKSWGRHYAYSDIMITNTYICKCSAQMRLRDQMACHYNKTTSGENY